MAKHILVVEDTSDLLTSIKDVLEMEGYRVSMASNGKDAVKMVSRIRHDLIITDLLMPEMNGFELIDHIRNGLKRSGTHILVYSAMPFLENRKRVLGQGASAYLKKPSSLNALVKSVYQLIKK